MMVDKKRILIFAHYYYPDVASTAQILKDQAEGMAEVFDVTVVCTVPSYTGVIKEEYKANRFYYEKINGVSVIRVRVSEFEKTNKYSRIIHIISYFFNALCAARKSGRQDCVFAVSQPPILGGLLGVLGKWAKHAKMIYCIQDFNPEQIRAVNYSGNKPFLWGMLACDKFSCRQSNLVITVGRDLVETLKKRFRGGKIPKYVMINNWIDEKKIYPLDGDDTGVSDFKRCHSLEGKFVIMYSGNIGLYYDLLNLLKVIRRFGADTRTADGREVVFVFVGSGAVLNKMIVYRDEHNMSNVKFLPYQEKKELIYSLNSADVHWCINAKGIKGVSCPSKFYGIAACGKPILGILEEGTEVRCLIEEAGCGLVSEPGNYSQARRHIQWFLDNAGSGILTDMGRKGYEYLQKGLTKEASIEKYVNAIMNIC